MAQLEGDGVFAVKGRFKAVNQGYYGQFFYLISQEGSYLHAANIVVATGQDLYNALNPTDSWKKFEEHINKRKYEKRYAQSITLELQAKLKNLTSDKQYYADLVKAVKSSKQDDIDFVLSSFYRRVIKDDEFHLEAMVEKASLNDANEAAEGATDAQNPQMGGIYLPVKLDLDPIHGKDVNALRVGEKIMIRVLPQTEQANSFIDGAGLRTESGFIRSTPFEITSIASTGKGLELVGKLKESVYGRILEEQNILVRTAENGGGQNTKESRAEAASNQRRQNVDNKQMTKVAVGVVLVGLLLVVLYWVFSAM